MDSKKIETLEKLKAAHQLEPYIRHIRFPKFRNLEKGLRLDFNFPITALVGPNGTNKSSILRAVYACPDGYSIENFWFSTAVDPIDEDGERSTYIYGYYQPDINEEVEVLKNRIKRVFKNKTDELNPEYWEPSRPLKKHGMKGMPPYVEGAPGRGITRWNLVDKNVVFLDFRSEISAFDKYFYHGDLTKTLKHQSKQSFLREKSKLIKNAIDRNTQSKKMYRGKKEHIFTNEVLDSSYVEVISNILGKEILEIRLVEHRFFKSRGFTVLFKTLNQSYSEAAAGSGEYAVAMQVYKILKAPKKSLIILDEPEVSLHPGAQEKLVEFLFDQVKEKYHQVVLGTHSPHILKHLPREAIKSLYIDAQKNEVKITKETSHEAAFYNIGYKEDSRNRIIFVEDRLAREIVLRALNMIGEATAKSTTVRYMPGGSSVLLNQYLLPLSQIEKKNCVFILDGDEELGGIHSIPNNLDRLDEDELDSALESLFGKHGLEFKTDGGTDQKKRDQRKRQKKKILDYCKTNLFYLPGKVVPEQFIWDNMGGRFRKQAQGAELSASYKTRFQLLARDEYGKADWEDVSGDEIFQIQKQCLSTVPDQTLSELIKFINGQ